MAEVYDGFISYSHAADDLLAPRLQSGLQRFAKPWWKRRAVRMFRDESSLAANPHLWSSITEALDSSEWFVLLLSEDAARSEWVGKEIEHWVANHEVSRILPVVTDGEFGWADGDVVGSSVPPALQGVFSEEPRWVDLRWARSDTQLDLKNPRFSDAVADIASAIRGIPKDELASEEVRQHRRTIRTAWAAGVVVLLLGIAATIGAIVAVGQSNEAQEQAGVARSRELAAAAASTLESDPELATLLAITSIQMTPDGVEPSVESLRALRLAESRNRLRLRLGPGEGPTRVLVELTRDGRTGFYLHLERREIGAFDPETGAELWLQPLEGTPELPFDLAVSPDGSLVAVAADDQPQFPSVSADAVARDGFHHRILILDASSGDVVATVPQECPGQYLGGSPFSPDGSVLLVNTGSADCQDDPDANAWVAFYDTETWTEIDTLQVDGLTASSAAFARDADVLLVFSPVIGDRIEVRSFPEFDLIRAFEPGRPGNNVAPSAISPDGDRVAFATPAGAGLAIHDVASGRFLGFAQNQPPFISHAAFSPDGQSLAVFTRTGTVVVDGHTGVLRAEVSDGSPVWTGRFSPDGNELITGEESGHVLVWDLGAGGRQGSPVGNGASAADWVNWDRVIEGPTAAVHAFCCDVFAGDTELFLHLIDELTEETVQSVPAANAAQLPDGRFVIVEQESLFDADGNRTDVVLGDLVIWDPQSDESTAVTECELLRSEALTPLAPPPICTNGEPAFAVHDDGESWIHVSPDGSLIAASQEGNGDGLLRVWDVTSLEVVQSIPLPVDHRLLALGDTWVAEQDFENIVATVYSLANGSVIAELSEPFLIAPRPRYLDDDRMIFFGSGIRVVDTGTWSVVAQWEPHGSANTRGYSISPGGDRLATAGEDGFVRIWEVSGLHDGELPRGQAPPLLDEIATEVIVSDVRWVSGDVLGLVTRGPVGWLTVTLDPDELVANAAAGLTRGFTDRECQTFRLDPCPTLEDLRSA